MDRERRFQILEPAVPKSPEAEPEFKQTPEDKAKEVEIRDQYYLLQAGARIIDGEIVLTPEQIAQRVREIEREDYKETEPGQAEILARKLLQEAWSYMG